MMELGADGVFVGSGIFKSEDPEKLQKQLFKLQRITKIMNYWQIS